MDKEDLDLNKIYPMGNEKPNVTLFDSLRCNENYRKDFDLSDMTNFLNTENSNIGEGN